MTQRQLAELLDTDSGLVSKWERGKHRPDDTNLVAIAHHTGHDVSWFYETHTDTPAAGALL